MSAILGILTALILIAVRWFRPKRAVEHQPVIVRRFFHPGHTWARETEDGDVLVGVDEFAQSVIGSIDEVRLPRLLRAVQQGGPAWYLRHGKRIVPIVSPVAGRIVAKNEMVLANPSLVNTSPYGDGWLVRIKPLNFDLQTKNLFTGKSAHEWQDSVKARLMHFFSATPVLHYQDGGEIVRDLADKCSDQEWDALVKEFFLTDNSHNR